MTPATTSPLAVILERHCPSTRSVVTGNRFGDLLPTSANLKEIPEGDYFARIILDTRPAGYAYAHEKSLQAIFCAWHHP